MKIKINNRELVDILQKVSGPTTTKQNFPVLNSVLIEAKQDTLTVTSTDLDITIVTKITTNIEKEGILVTPLKPLLAIIKELPTCEITLEEHKKNLLISCEQIEFKINTIAPEEFPQLPKVKEATLIKIHAQNFLNLIRLTSFCVGQEDTNYVLSGIFFEAENNFLTAAATDGKRLAEAKENLSPQQTELKAKFSFILPIKAVNELQRVLRDCEDEIYFYAEKNKVGFEIQNTQLVVRPIEGEFPNYAQYIPPKQKDILTISRREFLSSLRRAALLTTPDYQSVKFQLKKNNIVISKNTPQVGEMQEVLSCEYTGKPLTIGFNPAYLIDVLKQIDDEQVSLEFIDSDKPAVLRKTQYTYLVLPMRI